MEPQLVPCQRGFDVLCHFPDRVQKGLDVKYRHYKGNTYIYVGEALHTETKEPMVVYRDALDFKKLFTRPKTMFFEEVEPGVLRFAPIEKRVLLLEVRGKLNGMREVWMTQQELNRLIESKDVSPYMDVHEKTLLPAGDWDYILAYLPKVPDANACRVG